MEEENIFENTKSAISQFDKNSNMGIQETQ